MNIELHLTNILHVRERNRNKTCVVDESFDDAESSRPSAMMITSELSRHVTSLMTLSPIRYTNWIDVVMATVSNTPIK